MNPEEVVEYARPADTEPPEPELPTIGGFVQLPQAWHSSAGIIQNLVEHAVGGVGMIFSRAGSQRANHWHENDFHYLFVVSGSFRYEEWPPDKNHPDAALVVDGPHASACANRSDVAELRVGAGQMIFTPPNRSHRLTFFEDTTMVTISKFSRTHSDHEKDVRRLA